MAHEAQLQNFVHKAPSIISVTGATGSGKTTLLYAMIKYIDKLFDKQVHGIILCYSKFQEIYTKMQDVCSVPLIMHYGLPTRKEVMEYRDKFSGEHWILATDDLARATANSAEMLENFQLGSHHDNFSLIQLQQNFYGQGKFTRDMSLQFHYVYLLNQRRDRKQISLIGSQTFPGQGKKFREIFDDASGMSQPDVDSMTLPGYLLLDVYPHQNTQLELTTHRLPPGGKFVMYQV
jgi:hypothetical protein